MNMMRLEPHTYTTLLSHTIYIIFIYLYIYIYLINMHLRPRVLVAAQLAPLLGDVVLVERLPAVNLGVVVRRPCSRLFLVVW